MLLCLKAPLGWWCSRETGHDGPCAAHFMAEALTWENSVWCLFDKYGVSMRGRWVEAVNPSDPTDVMMIGGAKWLRLWNMILRARLQELLYVEE